MIDFRQAPFVVGVISTWDELKSFPARDSVPCDVLEVRLDKVGWEEDWLSACQSVETAGTPVLLTLRMEAEGGEWDDMEENRLPLLEQALRELSAVDIELQSNLCPRLADVGAQLGKPVVISYHDFQRTPDLETLVVVAERMAEYESALIKIAVMINTEADIETLEALLEKDFSRPICLIGMGALGQRTRLEFPARGSVFTYAFLDGATAPGQLSCAEVAQRLRGSENS